MSIIDGIKSEIIEKISAGYKEAVSNGSLPETDENIDISSLAKLEVPKDKSHGDFACNIAMVLAKQLKTAPRKIADAITSNIDKSGDIKDIEVAGAGFINFYLAPDWLYRTMESIEKEGSDYGKIDLGKGKKVMVEFVSANPTGPMHMGNARGGALGDCLASVLEYAGYDVTREFYISSS